MAASVSDLHSLPASQDSLASYYLGKLSLPDFALPPNQRPTVPFDQFTDTDDLPVVDFSAFALESDAHDRKAALQGLCKAAEDWGFFRLINHNIPVNLLSRLEEHADQFFTLPFEQKVKGSRSAALPYGYGCGSFPTKRDKRWNESLQFFCDNDAAVKIKNILEKVFPDEELHKNFCADVAQYMELVQALSHRLREVLSECLGLTPSYYNQFYERPNSSAMRINYYPPCPHPDIIMGIHEHTDPGTLTILHQSNTGGLQVQKDGEWVGVKPQLGSLIVNLGDCFQVFSNGRFKSAVHRAVLNKETPRLSIVVFYSCREDTIIQPAAPVVAEDRPPLYRPITWADYRAYFFGGEMNSKTIEFLKNTSTRK